ncbi:porphobilinogen deaminase [Malaya genurostris]|uniref:porphobilinogen deaminase n=1 Tax=Malaya genurostris TaxID=325434 RepID=UPI0026F3A3F0|nr:porphobilinogen deaminase [Malaya genurostris]XP_058461178.1 porphobilinogen deaminase [Malaya genurostris]
MADEETYKTIRVGSRKSELALIQTKYVINCLQKLFPNVSYEIHTMTTVGDRVLNKSLPKIGEKSLFTKDLEDALRTGGVDFVVHSLKDLPTSLPTGMAIGAVLEREDPRDALVLNEKHRGKTLTTLPAGAVIGTSSLRRSAQLARTYSHLSVCDIRGNLNTRLAKLDAESSKFAGIILAQAGLSRMGWDKRIDQTIEPTEILYAVGQGALAVECRSNDEYILDMLHQLCHLETQCRILAERSFLKTLGGGCSAPVAVYTSLKRKRDSTLLNITGAVWSLDGKTEIRGEDRCSFELNNDNEVDSENGNTLPVKKSRVEEDVTDDALTACSLAQKNVTQQQRKSPEIVDDSEPGCSQIKEKLDFDKFLVTHGEMFQKCPFSSEKVYPIETNAVKEQGQGDAKSLTICPSNSFPVGVDFMGDCPYVSTEQKVDKSGRDALKCPISGKWAGDKPAERSSLKATGLDKCPFLVQQAKIFDYNENLHRTIVTPTLEDSSEILFCGMFRHKNVQRSIFESVEKLGQRLAHYLISKGALDIMKCAQNEIHSKV